MGINHQYKRRNDTSLTRYMVNLRHNNGLRPSLVVSHAEESSSVWNDTRLVPVHVGGLDEEQGKIREGLLDPFLLLRGRSSRRGRNRIRPLRQLLVSPVHGTSRCGIVPAGSQLSPDPIEHPNPLSLPIEPTLREPPKRGTTPTRMGGPATRFRNDSHVPRKTELIARRLDPPTYLARIVRVDLLDFSVPNVRGDEDKREMLVYFGRDQFSDYARHQENAQRLFCTVSCFRLILTVFKIKSRSLRQNIHHSERLSE